MIITGIVASIDHVNRRKVEKKAVPEYTQTSA
jgi:hypothetical protein